MTAEMVPVGQRGASWMAAGGNRMKLHSAMRMSHEEGQRIILLQSIPWR